MNEDRDLLAALAGHINLGPGCGGWAERFDYDEDIRGFIVSRDEDWIVSVVPMIFNNRIMLGSVHEHPFTYTSGYCYDKGPSAFEAAVEWNPETQHHPQGFKKIAADGRAREAWPAESDEIP